MADQALFEINVSGTNVSERFNPILESLTVTDKVGTTSDTASIVLSDIGGAIILPQSGDSLTISLGFKSSGIGLVFDGTVDSVRSTGSRGGGRTLSISAKGFDTKGKAKHPLEFHKDDASLQDFMSEAADKAGLSFQADGSLGAVKRPYWVAGNESFIHLGQRIAREVGGNFKIAGGKGIISDKNGGQSVSGGSLTGVTAVFGAPGCNGLSWDISPCFLRPRFQQARARFYDMKKAKWDEVLAQIEGQGITSDATHTHRQTRADKDEANSASTDSQKSSERERGGGTVTIIGNPSAQPEGSCTVVGARPGIDGSYKIESVTHKLDRSKGYETTLELKHPEGDVGSDSREAE
jgi:phage protein D